MCDENEEHTFDNFISCAATCYVSGQPVFSTYSWINCSCFTCWQLSILKSQMMMISVHLFLCEKILLPQRLMIPDWTKLLIVALSSSPWGASNTLLLKLGFLSVHFIFWFSFLTVQKRSWNLLDQKSSTMRVIDSSLVMPCTSSNAMWAVGLWTSSDCHHHRSAIITSLNQSLIILNSDATIQRHPETMVLFLQTQVHCSQFSNLQNIFQDNILMLIIFKW